VAEEVLLQEEKVCTKKRRFSGGRSDRNSGPEKVVWWKKLCSREGGFGRKFSSEVKVLQTELKTF
jgi:hypothetical protein